MILKSILRPAVPADFPYIEGWRAAHFLEMQARQKTKRPVSGQAALDEAAWLVAEVRGVPVAAVGFRDDLAEGVRRVTDLYSAQGEGRWAFRLGALVEEMADELGLEIRCTTDPENWHFMRIILARGYEPTLVSFRRRARDGR